MKLITLDMCYKNYTSFTLWHDYHFRDTMPFYEFCDFVKSRGYKII